MKWKDLITTDPFFKDNSSEIDDPIPIILVQNKIDLRETEKMKEFMSPEFLQSFAKKNKFFAAFQTSAKTSENLGELFELLVEEILIRKVFNYKKQIDDFEEKKRKKSLSLTQRNQSGKCC